MNDTAIPALSRTLVKVREQERCARCGMPAPNGHWHHRRSRSVRTEHRHCPCNGVWLCRTCHEWVHANPFMARQAGFILARHVAEPFDHPVVTSMGSRWHTCDGEVEYETEEQP